MNYATERMVVGQNKNRGLGWRPDLPDFRDYTTNEDTVSGLLMKINAVETPAALPKGPRASRPPSPNRCLRRSICGSTSRPLRTRKPSVPARPTRASAWSSTSSGGLSANTSTRRVCSSTK